MVVEEGEKDPSHRNVSSNRPPRSLISQLPFNPLPHLLDHILQKELQMEREMEVEVESSHPKVTFVSQLGKCIPQVSTTPRYVVNLTKVGEHTQFMKDHALIGKFLGFWPSEWDLFKWINTWWKIKGYSEIQLGSKGLFTTLRTHIKYLKMDPIFVTLLNFTSYSRRIDLSQKKKTSPMLWSRLDSIHFLRSVFLGKSLRELVAP